jgi:broad specificity phosphatase PhoE
VKTLELRRHSLRDKPEEHLSRAGRELARQVGSGIGPFRKLYSSPSLRAVETAEEMGFPDPELRPVWEALGPEIDAEVAWPSPFAGYAPPLRYDTATRRKARTLRSELEEMLRSLPDATRGLVVTHGGFPELVAVALFPRADPSAWGGPLRCLEGIRIFYEAERPRECRILRLAVTASRV